MHIIDGRAVADQVYTDLKERIRVLIKRYRVNPELGIIACQGMSEASKSYIMQKKKACERLGIDFHIRIVGDGEGQKKLNELCMANRMKHIPTIIQLPVKGGLDPMEALEEMMDPWLDVDGFLSNSPFTSCTPKGVMTLIDSIPLSLEGRNVLVIGRSNIVGQPIAQMCLRRDATVMVAHSHTEHLGDILRWFPDLIISATGVPGIVNPKCFDKDRMYVVIDVGIARGTDGKLRGDMMHDPEYDRLCDNVWYTPVPGGVGPMTVASLMQNVVESYEHYVSVNPSL